MSSKHTKKEYSAPVFIGQNVYIKPNYVVSIPEFHKENRASSLEFIENQKNLLENDHKGKLSRKAIQRLRNSINWLCLAAEKKRVYDKSKDKTFYFKVNFVTLTLPDTEKPIGSAELQKKILNPWLSYMRQYHGLKNYVWRLEFQANGKLHVHITTDTFLHLQVIRDSWNRLLADNGYLDLFFKNNGHFDPNSTDVHATKKIKNIAAYLAKYMSKKNSVYAISKPSKKAKIVLRAPDARGWYKQRLNFWNSPFNPRPITGRIWSCNRELSAANKCVVHVPANECAEELKCLMRPDIEYKEIYSVPKKKTIHAQFAPDHPSNQPQKIGEVYFLSARDWFEKITGVIRKKFDETRRNIANLVTVRSFELALE